ncbi:hypothetical protein [Paracoccus pantotrophus]|uniref:hypothetical protein n=1 Tax=Paracoccus pantotrophus TaxID=82367 RepID=UPI0015F1076A|nr:hypothetical protein [Paracoccus pantotrophus]
MYIAIDTSITHTYEPGMRMHIQNALRYGATPLIKTGDIDISMCEAWIRTGELGAEALFQAATDPATPKGRLVEYQPELITAENTDTICPPQW